jgi:hypothetical protein
MSPIKPYTVKSTSITLNNAEYDKYRPFGGYDEVKKAYTPLRFAEISDELEGSGTQVNYALDSITLAMEAGIFKDSDTFVAKAFATTEDAAEFVEALRGHEYYWLNERHFYAFSHAFNCDESQMRTYPEIADFIANEI